MKKIVTGGINQKYNYDCSLSDVHRVTKWRFVYIGLHGINKQTNITLILSSMRSLSVNTFNSNVFDQPKATIIDKTYRKYL